MQFWSGRTMSRVEVIVERKRLSKREERFSDWSVGYVRRVAKVVQELCANDCVDVVSVVEGDMFKVFDKYWREAKRVREVLSADVAVGICSDNECIDLSNDVPFVLITSKYRLYRLMKAKCALEMMIGRGKLDKVLVTSEDGVVTLNIEGCFVNLYVDEAIALSGLLLSHLYDAEKREVIWKLYVDIGVFEAHEIGLEVNVKGDERGFYIELDTCNVYLTHEEVLQLVYSILDESIWRIEVGGYE
jgi:hypothetical protein